MNLEEIKELMRVFGRSKLGELRVKDGEFEIEMKKGGNEVVATTPAIVQEVVAPQTPVVTSQPETKTDSNNIECVEGEIITSPMVGTFYAAPSPDSPPFVKVGDSVKKGQTLCILEAMKIMNELEAEFDCKILEILVKDGEPVEYDTPLFKVEKL